MTNRSLPAPPATRELRGIKLYRERGHEITRVYPSVYRVPSCSGETVYTVHLAPASDATARTTHGTRSLRANI